MVTSTRSLWLWWFIFGLLLIISGIVFLASPVVTSLASVVVLGSLLMFAGVVHLICAFLERGADNFWVHVLIAALTLVVGILMLTNPTVTLVTLTLLIAALFLSIGLFRMISSVVARFRGWGWVLLNGVISFILGILIIMHWPASSLWVIGLFIAIDLIFAGWTLIMIALLLKKQTVAVSNRQI